MFFTYKTYINTIENNVLKLMAVIVLVEWYSLAK